ncbi:MAG: double-strand break repair helicase AddA [Pseudomonadota bacterium]
MDNEINRSLNNQLIAAQPTLSAWVGANAGSGKTRVLTNRVARLLLAGADPAAILCITYTKAAAAEMATRLSDLLGGWALAENTALEKALRDLEGGQGGADDQKAYSEDALSHARRLFARALETPGGLKIQTIHAFCEKVLQRFPLEAGVAPGFEVLDEAAATTLIEGVLDTLARRRHGRSEDDKAIAAAFAHLGQRYNPTTLTECLQASLSKSSLFEAAVHDYGSAHAMLDAFAETTKIDPAQSPAALQRAMATLVSTQMAEDWAAQLADGKQRAADRGTKLLRLADAGTDTDVVAILIDVLLKADGTPAKVVDADVKAAHPTLEEEISAVQRVLTEIYSQYKAQINYEDTHHFLTLAGLLHDLYTTRKRAQGVLDFDDLVSRTRDLFSRGETGTRWIMYKLDQGLDHILVDETQDTSPNQWQVIEGPLGEFFTGLEQARAPRTFFAVGDQKQSIYSFQGADASLFSEKQATIGKAIAASGAPFRDVPLTLSFRSTAPVLQFVDAVFSSASTTEGLGDQERLHHGVFRVGSAGRVTLLPFTPKPGRSKAKPWDAPLDASPPENPVATLCAHVAGMIADWLADPAPLLTPRGRRIMPEDIVILVQSRGAPFHQMIKALNAKNIPVAGTDRLHLLDDIAVLDLLSFAQTALLLHDDLSLAEALKSPLLGLDENALFDLAHGREGTLWSSLREKATENTLYSECVGRIREAQAIGLNEGPYAFFSHLLETGTPSGRQRFYDRLGTSCADSINAFIGACLDYEQSHTRSLQGFVTAFAQDNTEIKRDLDQVSDAVRIMTVHGAKGLEGNIVFLLDATRKPATGKDGPVKWVVPAQPRYGETPNRPTPMPILLRDQTLASTPVTIAKETAKRRHYEEYRRLLYVAATRARDWLFICGYEGRGKPNPEKKNFKPEEASWYELSQIAFDKLRAGGEEIVREASCPWDGESQTLTAAQTAQINGDPTPTDAPLTMAGDDEPAIPVWMTEPAAAERARVRLAPSHAADALEKAANTRVPEAGGANRAEDEATEDTSERMAAAAYDPVRDADRYERGRLLHRLLEKLPACAADTRGALADQWLARHAGHVPAETRAQWRDEVLAVLALPALVAAFGPGSRAEVSLAGTLDQLPGEPLITGQIDRLLVRDGRALIIDYKTNQPPPATEAGVAPAYLAQMALYRALVKQLYPDHEVDAGLLWTWDARFMPLSPERLDHAFARLKGGS